MSTDSSTDDHAPANQPAWVAGYPPWFASFWIKPAGCETVEQASRLLHLLRSIEDGDAGETRRLLQGVDPNLRLGIEGEQTESLLEWAAEKARDPDCVRLLVASGASVQAPNLVYKFVVTGKTDLLGELLAAGADPNAGPDDTTALIRACWDNPEAVRLLLGAGARTDVTTTFYVTNKKRVTRVTPLMIAAHAGAVKCVKLLLDAGVNVEAVDSAGHSAVDWAKASRAKKKGAEIVRLLEQAGAPTPAAASGLPEPPADFAARAKRPEFREALKLARALTKSRARVVQLAEGPLPGAKAFRVPNGRSATELLDEIRPKLEALGTLAFLSETLCEMSVPYLVLLPTTDWREAVVALETPEGQPIDSHGLIAWLTELEKSQPFVLTHLAPDQFRARFTGPLNDPARLAEAIEKICPDVINVPLRQVAKHLEKSRELYLWWD